MTADMTDAQGQIARAVQRLADDHGYCYPPSIREIAAAPVGPLQDRRVQDSSLQGRSRQDGGSAERN